MSATMKEIDSRNQDACQAAERNRGSRYLGAWLLAVCAWYCGSLAAVDAAAAGPAVLSGHSGAVRTLDFSADGKRLVSSDGTTVLLWELATGKSSTLASEQGSFARFSSSGKHVFVGNVQKVAVYSAETGEGIRLFGGTYQTQDDFHMVYVPISDSGRTVVTQDKEGHFVVRDGGSSKELLRVDQADGRHRVAVSHDGQKVAISTAGGVRLFSIATQQELPGIRGLQEFAELRFSPDDKLLLLSETRDQSGDIERWSAWDVSQSNKPPAIKFRTPYKGGPRHAPFSPDGKTLVLGVELLGVPYDKARIAVLVDCTTWKQRAMIPNAMAEAVYSADGSTLVFNTSPELIIVNAKSGTVQATVLPQGLRKSERFRSAVAVSPDGSVVAIGSDGGEIAVQAIKSTAPAPSNQSVGGFREIASLPLPPEWTGKYNPNGNAAVVFSPDNRHVIASPHLNVGDPQAVLYNLTTRNFVRSWMKLDRAEFPQISRPNLHAFMFMPDGKQLFVSIGSEHSPDPTAKKFLYDLTTLRPREVNDPAGYFQLQVSPDGKWIAADASSKESGQPCIAVTNVKDKGKPVRLSEPHAASGGSNSGHLAFSPDGKLLTTDIVTVHDTHEIKVWELETKQERLVSLKGPDTRRGLAFVGNSTLVGVDDRGKAQFNDVESGQIVKAAEYKQGHTGDLHGLAFSPTQPIVATGGDFGELLIRNTHTGEVILRLPGHTNEVVALGFSNDGTRLASAGLDGKLLIWEVPLSIGVTKPVAAAAAPPAQASPAQAVPATNSNSPVANVAKPAIPNGSGKTAPLISKQPQEKFALSTQGLLERVSRDTEIAFSRDGSVIAAYELKDCAVWNLKSGEAPFVPRAEGLTLTGTLKISPDGQRVFIAGYAGGQHNLLAFNVPERKRHESFLVPRTENELWKMSGDGQSMIVCAETDEMKEGKLLYLVDVNTLQVKGSLDGYDGYAREVAYSSDGSVLAALLEQRQECSVVLLDPQNLSVIEEIKTLAGEGSRNLQLSADGKLLAIHHKGNSSRESGVVIWDIAQHKLRGKLGEVDYDGGPLRFLDNDRLLAVDSFKLPHANSGTREATALIDTRTGQPRGELLLEGHYAISHDGRMLARSHKGRRIVWGLNGKALREAEEDGRDVEISDAVTGAVHVKFRAHVDDVVKLEFSPDGRSLATVGQEGKIKIWALE